MISRRNIRVKVMQALYTLETTADVQDSPEYPAKLLKDKLERSLDLFLVMVSYVSEVAGYATTDARKKASRMLSSDADKAVSTKITENTFLQKLLSDPVLKEKIKTSHAERFVSEDLVKAIYGQLIQAVVYKDYIATEERLPQTEKGIIRYIWDRHIAGNEALADFFNDEMPGWEDDLEMTRILMDHLFRSAGRIHFDQLISTEKQEYACNLLNSVLEKKAYCMELIQPKLVNWDAERVALIDLLLLQMGVCELLYFPTIPTKVTINEYIEVAKRFSTPQSGQFVNGVLDNLLKELEHGHKINKEERFRKP